ncbi:MAG: hypothetical protein HY359_14030 [Candidatus Rokubacteria bacterium]|nr:hypothetical protein [Candidatus Rokubacteria bacterium]
MKPGPATAERIRVLAVEDSRFMRGVNAVVPLARLPEAVVACLESPAAYRETDRRVS